MTVSQVAVVSLATVLLLVLYFASGPGTSF